MRGGRGWARGACFFSPDGVFFFLFTNPLAFLTADGSSLSQRVGAATHTVVTQLLPFLSCRSTLKNTMTTAAPSAPDAAQVTVRFVTKLPPEYRVAEDPVVSVCVCVEEMRA